MFEDMNKLADIIAPVVKSYVAEAIAPLKEENETLRKRLDNMPKPENGKDGVVDYDQVKALIDEAVNAIPAPEKGEDGQDGKDVDPDTIKSMIEEAINALPKPQDGKSVTIDELLPIVEECVQKAVKALPEPTNAKSAIIDRDGTLQITFTDGSIKSLGQVVGKDGRDGNNGKDGKDGFGFDEMDVKLIGREMVLEFMRGDELKSFNLSLPIMMDKGVFKEGIAYEKGDSVSFGGSIWIAQKATMDKPGTGGDWRLAVKKGRDGRDGVMKPSQEGKTFKLGAAQ